MKISVITPSYNSAATIENAIKNVLSQNYPDFEHIIIDANSNDGTLEILKKYPHLKWLSEPDRGQSDAMNKGFRLADGEIISYLNADDFYEPNAFQKVSAAFDENTDMVMGKVNILDGDFKLIYINDAGYELRSMLNWWRPQSYCFNPTGYFYRRQVQQTYGGFPEENHYDMDYDFLLWVATHESGRIKKIDEILGNFVVSKTAKTYLVAHGNIARHYHMVKRHTMKKYLDYLPLIERTIFREFFLRSMLFIHSRDWQKMKKSYSFTDKLTVFIWLIQYLKFIPLLRTMFSWENANKPIFRLFFLITRVSKLFAYPKLRYKLRKYRFLQFYDTATGELINEGNFYFNNNGMYFILAEKPTPITANKGLLLLQISGVTYRFFHTQSIDDKIVMWGRSANGDNMIAAVFQ